VRVLLVTHRFPPDGYAGVERTTEALAASLSKGGSEVHIVARRATAAPAQPGVRHEELPLGATLHRFVGGGADSAASFPSERSRLMQLFTRTLIETAPDVIHFQHLLGLPPNALEEARNIGSAVVLSLHDFFFACPLVHLRKTSGALCDGPNGGRECANTCFAHEGAEAVGRWSVRATYFRRLLTRAHFITCPSAYAGSFFARFGIPENRLRIVPNGVSRDLFRHRIQPAGRTDHALTLGYFGTIAEHKGVHVLLRALRLATLGPVNLRLCGDIVDRSYASELRKDAERVPNLSLTFYGAYEPSELSSLVRGTDCVVVPSVVPETGGLVAQEALACGVPVVAAAIGALTELVQDGANGLTFETDRPGALAEALQRLASDPKLLPRLREGARTTTVQSVEEYTDQIRQVYSEALEMRAIDTPAPGEIEEINALRRLLGDDNRLPVSVS
jgi:glycosyltransferase involved in cell wall biosynthesis